MPKSPLTGVEVNFQFVHARWPFHFIHDESTIGQWAVTQDLLDCGFTRNSDHYRNHHGLTLERKDLQKVLALAASKVYLETKRGRTAMFMKQDHLDSMLEHGQFSIGGWVRMTPYTIEDLLAKHGNCFLRSSPYFPFTT